MGLLARSDRGIKAFYRSATLYFTLIADVRIACKYQEKKVNKALCRLKKAVNVLRLVYRFCLQCRWQSRPNVTTSLKRNLKHNLKLLQFSEFAAERGVCENFQLKFHWHGYLAASILRVILLWVN